MTPLQHIPKPRMAWARGKPRLEEKRRSKGDRDNERRRVWQHWQRRFCTYMWIKHWNRNFQVDVEWPRWQRRSQHWKGGHSNCRHLNRRQRNDAFLLLSSAHPRTFDAHRCWTYVFIMNIKNTDMMWKCLFVCLNLVALCQFANGTGDLRNANMFFHIRPMIWKFPPTKRPFGWIMHQLVQSSSDELSSKVCWECHFLFKNSSLETITRLFEGTRRRKARSGVHWSGARTIGSSLSGEMLARVSSQEWTILMVEAGYE